MVVQRQSIIHSMVQFSDNSILAQLGVPDMRIPIQYALTWPERVPGPAPELDFTKLHELTFDTADEATFRCLAACKKQSARAALHRVLQMAQTKRRCVCFWRDAFRS